MINRPFLKREIARTRLVSWLWLALAFGAMVAAADMFRYEVIGEHSFLYDRWKHRTCIPELSDGGFECKWYEFRGL